MKKRLMLSWCSMALAVTISMGLTSPVLGQEDRLRGTIEPVKAKKKYRIGVAVVHFVDDYWKGMAYGLVEEAKEANVEIVRILAAGGYGKVAEQIAQIETLATLNLDAVILGAVNYDGFDRAIQRLTDRGIKVIAAGIPVNSKFVSLGVTMDEIAIGKTLASYVCKQNPNAKLLTIPGPSGPAWNKLRFDGVRAGAKECPGMQLLGNTFAGDTKIEDGQAQASDLLIKYPDAHFIYAAAANLGTGAALAARGMKRPAKVVTATVTSRTLDLMKDGHIAMVVSEPGILIGRSIIQYTTRLLNGDPLPNLTEGGPIPYKQFLVPLTEITNATLGSYKPTSFDQPPPNWQVPSL